MKTIAHKSKLLRLREAAAYLHAHRNTLRNWDNAGKLKAIRYGWKKERRYDPATLDSFLKKQKVLV